MPTSGWSLHLGHELALDQRWLLFADLEHSRYEGGAWLAGYGGRQFGLGRAKIALADGLRSSVERELMARLKRALDPAGTMNPGVLLA